MGRFDGKSVIVTGGRKESAGGFVWLLRKPGPEWFARMWMKKREL